MAKTQQIAAWRGQVRMPMPLALWLKQKAEKNFRSLNGELVDLVRRLKEEQEAKQ